MSKRMVWICWKDIRHPEAGGAELVHHEISKRLVRDGWEVIHLVPGYKNCPAEEWADGVRVIRIGQGIFNFYRLPFYFWRHLRGTTDFLVDAFISMGSFTCLTMPRSRAAILIHHIEDTKWFSQTSFYGVPCWIMPFFNVAGYFVEKLELFFLALFFRGTVITGSESTAGELCKHGFRRKNLRLITYGIATKPLPDLSVSLAKDDAFTVLMIGPRKAKRPLHTLKAYEVLLKARPDARLWVAGWGNETEAVKAYIEKHNVRNVTFWGRVSDEQRNQLLQRAHVLCTTPLREGWGLVVIEANAMGTPVIGYNVPGLRDALAFGNGWLCEPNPAAMAEKLVTLAEWVADKPADYEALRKTCLESARPFTFEKAYEDFMAVVAENIPRIGDSG